MRRAQRRAFGHCAGGPEFGSCGAMLAVEPEKGASDALERMAIRAREGGTFDIGRQWAPADAVLPPAHLRSGKH
jgi:hypothetical protein